MTTDGRNLRPDLCATIAGRRLRTTGAFELSIVRTSGNMALSATEIEYVLHEIAPVLVQGRIQKIHQPGDRLLLCSDGLTEMVPHGAIAAVLLAEPDPEAACTKLMGST